MRVGACDHPSTKSYRAYIAIVAMCAAICSYIHSFMFPLTSHVGTSLSSFYGLFYFALRFLVVSLSSPSVYFLDEGVA